MNPADPNGTGLDGRDRPEAISHRTLDLSPAAVEALALRVAELSVPPVRPFVGVDEAAAFLGVQSSWLAARARNGEAPCRRMGKYVRFDLVELRTWVDATAASGPGAGCGPVPVATTSEHPSASTRGSLVEVPSVVPSRDRRAA